MMFPSAHHLFMPSMFLGMNSGRILVSMQRKVHVSCDDYNEEIIYLLHIHNNRL